MRTVLALSLGFLFLEFASTSRAQSDNRATVWGEWPTWGDQGDGSYLNPVLPADYSDIDCIRVGADYYAISSTFQYSPGVVILHSKDLVNWEIAGHAVNDVSQISMAMNYTQMNRYGHGIWAGGIRYHDGKFWIYFGTPDEGYFMTTATDPAGPWDPLTKVLASSGWDDCCPFWDDNGQGYLVGTNYANGYTTTIYKLSADGKQIQTDTGVVINQGSGREANKLYKINGIYYHLFSETSGGARVVKMQRSSTSVMGPYTDVQQLTEGNSVAKQPNQGGLIQAQNGNWYFYTHHGTGAWEGRCNSLLPVTWINNWPIIGTVDAKGLGTMTWTGGKPVAGTPLATPRTSDEFSASTLPPQWEWNYQPRADYWSLTERPGWLRLKAFRPLATNDLTKAGNTLTQRSFRTNSNAAIAKLDLSGMVNGQKAGLSHFTKSSPASFGVTQSGTTRSLELKVGSMVTAGPALTGSDLWLRSTWGLDGVSQFSYSTDGVSYTNFGGTYQLLWSSYRGDRLGLYCFNNLSDSGRVDVDYFRYAIQPSAPAFVKAARGNGGIDLQWSQVREASAYQVKRTTVGNGIYSPVGSPVSGLTYSDPTAASGTAYSYVVTTVPVAPASPATSAPAVVAAVPVPNSINQGLLARLRFDETGAAVASDASGNGQDAALFNAPAWGAGKINGALALNGANQYGALPGGVVSGLSGDFSIAAWVKLNAVSNWARIFDFGTGQSAYMFLTPQNGSTARLRFAITTGGGTNEQRIDGSAALPAGVWTHVAITVAGNVGTLYVNGSAVGTNSAMTLKPAGLGATTQNYLGKSQFSDPYLNGSLDEFEIASRAFSAAEVAALAAPPTAPAEVSAVNGDGLVSLSWNAVPGAAAYNVRRATAGGGPYVMLAENVVASGYADSTAVNGAAYFYVVTTAGNVVESANSNEANATPSLPISNVEAAAPSIALSNGDATIMVRASVPGHRYQLQSSATLLQNSWLDVGSVLPGTGGDLLLSPPPTGTDRRFYRMRIQRPDHGMAFAARTPTMAPPEFRT